MRAFPRLLQRHNQQGKGYSILEALVVIALMGVLLAIVLPALYRFFQVYRVQTAAQRLAINIRFARNAAVKQKVNYRITVRDETHGSAPNTYIFENDPEGDGTFASYDNLDVSIPSGVLIKSGSVSQLEFDSRGRSSASGVIRLEGKSDTEYEISVSINGAVSSQRM
jgi:Tfp pilus assembly protein FimT